MIVLDVGLMVGDFINSLLLPGNKFVAKFVFANFSTVCGQTSTNFLNLCRLIEKRRPKLPRMTSTSHSEWLPGDCLLDHPDIDELRYCDVSSEMSINRNNQ